jgi:hypothetical protein
VTSIEKVTAVIDALNELEIAYMLTGSLASNMYGIVRATQDADFVVQVEACEISRIAGRLEPIFSLDPQASFETVTMTMRYVFVSADEELKVELFLLSEDPHDKARFQRRRQGTFEGRAVAVPTPEDIVVSKLRWYRPKDIDDVRNVLSMQAGQLDEEYIQLWCDRHGTRDRLDRIRKSIPKRPNERGEPDDAAPGKNNTNSV